MPFSAELSSLCSMLNRTNKDIAERCGISGSALSRYRNGGREPKANSKAVQNIAAGLAALGEEEGLGSYMKEQDILNALNASLEDPVIAGKRLCERFRRLVLLLKIRNAEVAHALGVDSSYVSRIRNGQRFPGDRAQFADAIAELAVHHYYQSEQPPDLMELLGLDSAAFPAEYTFTDQNELYEVISTWLLGGETSSGRATEATRLFEELSHFNYDEFINLVNQSAPTFRPKKSDTAVSRFYSGVNGMRSADLEFLRLCVASPSTKNVFIQSDMPLAEKNAESDYLRAYAAGIAAALNRGIHMTVVHNLNRPFAEIITGIMHWTPIYMTGLAEPRYITGVNNRVFCRVNIVSEVAALCGEAVVGHEADERCYLTTKKEEVAYYRRKMGYILENTLPLMEVYREDQPESMAAFEKAKQQWRKRSVGRVIAEDYFENVRIETYGPDCVLVTKTDAPVTHFVIYHPKICYAINSIGFSGQ